ncbi:NmrA family protein [Phlyctema vagabunda]|uniref:NmrA family protein n=1 Tax=Phlyctema vagabunda TaxID=108571 RepID=A0ABR4PM58_9HELO
MPKKKILLLGCTGSSGIKTLEKALAQGHLVTVYARSPEKVPDHLTGHPHFKMVEGTLTSTDILFPLLPEFDTIISLLGPINIRHKQGPLAEFWRTLLTQLKTLPEPPHVLAMGTISLKDPSDKFSLKRLALVGVVSVVARGAYKEIQATAAAFREEGNGVPWTNWRVAMLSDGKGATQPVAGSVGKDGWKLSTSKENLATWLVEEAEKGSKDSEWIGKFPALWSGTKKKL